MKYDQEHIVCQIILILSLISHCCTGFTFCTFPAFVAAEILLRQYKQCNSEIDQLIL